MKKNITRKLKSILAFSLAAILILAACGCKNKVKADGILDEGEVPVPEGKVRLQYQLAATEADKRSVNDWIAAFTKMYPKVKVTPEFSTSVNVPAQISSRTIADVFFFWETDVYNYAVSQEALMPLDYYAEAYGIETGEVFNAIYDMGVINGKLYMVMRDYNHIVLVYNKDIINGAGLADPQSLEKSGDWTWDTFKSYCEGITNMDDSIENPNVGCALRLGYAPLYIPVLEGWGGKWFDTANKKVSFIDDEKVLEGINEMVTFVQSNNCCFRSASDSGLSANSIQATESQRSYSGYEGLLTTNVGFFDTEFPNFASIGDKFDQQGTSWDVISMPKYPTHKVGTGATGFGVFAYTKNPHAAAALCLSLYTPAGQKAYNGQEGGSVPNVKSLADDSFWRVPYPDASVDADDPDAKNYFAFTSFPEADTYGRVECVLPPEIATIVRTYMTNVIPDAVNGVRAVDVTLQELQTTANEKWAQIYKG